MKLLLKFLILFIVGFNNVQAQWQIINLNTTESFKQIQFINNSIGFINSERVLYKTLDAGITWDSVYFQVSDFIADFHFLTPDTGFLEINNTLKKTTDGGATWFLVNNGLPNYGDLFFINSSEGVLFTEGFNIYKTLDGGNNWNSVGSHGSGAIGNIFFITDSIGFFAGWYPGTISKTFDGGNTWQVVEPNFLGEYYAIFFPSLNVGYAVDNTNLIVKTNNGGVTWSILSSNVSIPKKLASIDCPNENTCYAVGDSGTVIKTTDGGINWQEETSGTTEKLNAVFCTNTYCYAIGDNGVMLRTPNIVGIDEKINPKRIKIYPNPIKETVTIEIEKRITVNSIHLLDLNGKLIRRFSKDSTLLNLSAISKGIYILKIETQEGVFNKQIIKE